MKLSKYSLEKVLNKFPTGANGEGRCFQGYLDFYRCINIHGEDYGPCQFLKKSFQTICPVNLVEKWDEQREAGTLLADLTE